MPFLERCQSCDTEGLEMVLSLGDTTPVNQMQRVGDVWVEQPKYPIKLMLCHNCDLVQIGYIADAETVFPKDYPYTSNSTFVLRANFADLAAEVLSIVPNLKRPDFVVDIGSNDGTLLANFANTHRVLGIEPTDVATVAQTKGIPTIQEFFNPRVAQEVVDKYGQAGLVTAANCFAHIDDVHSIIEGVKTLLRPDGTFVTESHYLMKLIETCQYDTIYHEHLRYYTVATLRSLLRQHDLEVYHARHIPSHGGSIRVYAARKGVAPERTSVKDMIDHEFHGLKLKEALGDFATRVRLSKEYLGGMIDSIKYEGETICGVSAPSRASTMINYVGLDNDVIEYVAEIPTSLKIGRYMPGTKIPVVDEARMIDDQPDYALIFSWHIADELMPKLRAKGYKGKFIIPLPIPRIVE